MDIKIVGVIGSGTMGSGIAQTIAQHGCEVILYDINEEVVSRGVDTMISRLQRLVEKKRLNNKEYETIKKQIHTSTDLKDLNACQLIIEVAPENIKIKKDIFQKLDEYCSPETLLLTNTSSFSITEIASVTNRAEKVAGMHFFNPAPLMKLVEVIRGLSTSEVTIQIIYDFALKLDKKPVVCKDTTGFIVNRVARPFYNEALRIMGDNIASIEQIDRIMKQAGNFKMGPFELQDLIGIDINYSVTESVHQGFFGEPRFRPHSYQKRMMQSGNLGKKVGRGYYNYD